MGELNKYYLDNKHVNYLNVFESSILLEGFSVNTNTEIREVRLK